jgi:hypothetical protein
LTVAAIKEMIIPSLLPVLSPVVLYFIILSIGGQVAALASVGAMLLGVIITGLFVAVSMTAAVVVHGITLRSTLKMEITAEKVQKLTRLLLLEILWEILQRYSRTSS